MKRQYTAVLCICLTLAAPCWANYNPRIGRFLQRDPVGPVNPAVITPLVNRAAAFVPNHGVPYANREYHDGMNLYQYGRSNPLTQRDPSGQFSVGEVNITTGILVLLVATMMITAMPILKKSADQLGTLMGGVIGMAADDFEIFVDGIAESIAGRHAVAEACFLAATAANTAALAWEVIFAKDYAGKTVATIIKNYRKGSIMQTPLPPGGPGWDEILRMTWEEIQKAARQGKRWAKTVHKLLTDGRFAK